MATEQKSPTIRAKQRGKRIVTVEVPSEMHDTLKQYAGIQGISVSAVVRYSIANFFGIDPHTGCIPE